MSLESTETIATISNILIVIGAVFALVGTIGSVWSAGEIGQLTNLRITENEAKAKQALADVAMANARAAQLEKDAAEARLETEKIKKQFSWRRLSKQQTMTIIENVKTTYSNMKLPLVLSAISSDPESLTYASDIQAAIQKGGRTLSIRSLVVLGSGPETDIEVSGPNNEDIDIAAQALINAGLIVNTRVASNANEVEIMVGSRPPPVL